MSEKSKLDLLIEQFGFEKTKTSRRNPIETKTIIIDGQEVEVKIYATPERKATTMKSNERRQNRSGYRERIGGVAEEPEVI